MNVSETQIKLRRSLSKRRVLVALGCVLALVVLGLFMRSKDGEGGRGDANAPVPVAYEAVHQGDMRVTLDAIGTVASLDAVTVKTQISGQLIGVAFQEGELVRAGDFLAQIDPRPYQLALSQAEGQLLRDQALLKDAELNLTRYQKLMEEDSISQQQLDTQAATVQQYRGVVQADQATIDAAKLNLTYCHISAPTTGKLGIRSVDQGNYVQVNDSIVTITQMQPITVLFTLPEDSVPALMRRMKDKDKPAMEVVAYDRTQTTQLAQGKLVSVDNQIDTNTGTVKLRAQFDNQDETLFPNQFVNVRLLVDIVHDALIMPVAAVQRGAQGSYAYVITPENKVMIRQIKLGQVDNDQVTVVSGLQVGDRVVTDGADKLREGAAVALPQEKAATGK